jgi:hypothetical protein
LLERTRQNEYCRKTFKITIKDTNGSVFKEFDVLTNEYGSFSGEFFVPKKWTDRKFQNDNDEMMTGRFCFAKTKGVPFLG